MPQKSVLLKVPMAANTGYGNDGFALARAFHEVGVDVRLQPTAVVPPVPMGAAMLLVKALDADFDLMIHHVDPDNLGLEPHEHRIPGKKIAWSMWEFTNYPDDTLAERLDGYDLFLAYDEVSAEAFAPHCEKAGVPLKILQGGVWAEDWQHDPRERDWTGPFRFGMVGQLHQRKNPFAAIEAFREVHEEYPHAELHLKTSVRTLHPAIQETNPGIFIHYEIWSQQRLKEFYKSLHCYVAPSWGEGKNLPALESQLMGIPAIYSDFGGHRQWGSSETGWPVSGTIAEHLPGYPSFRVDHDSLVAAMKEAIANPSRTRMKGAQAAGLVAAQSDWVNVVKRLLVIV